MNNNELPIKKNSFIQLNKYFSFDSTTTYNADDEANMMNRVSTPVNDYNKNPDTRFHLCSMNSCTALLQLINEQSGYNATPTSSTSTTLSTTAYDGDDDNDNDGDEDGEDKNVTCALFGERWDKFGASSNLVADSSDNTPSNTVFNTKDRYEYFTYGFDHFDIEEKNSGYNKMRKMSWYDNDSNAETANVSEDETEICMSEVDTTSAFTGTNTVSKQHRINLDGRMSLYNNKEASEVNIANKISDANAMNTSNDEEDDDGIVICPSKVMNCVDPAVLYSKLVVQKYYSKKMSETPMAEENTSETSAKSANDTTSCFASTNSNTTSNDTSHTPCLPPKDKQILDDILEAIATPTAPTDNPFTLSSSSSVQSTPRRTSQKYDESERTFQCDKCPRAFFRSEHLRRHMNSVHLQLKKYQCMVCYKMGIQNKFFARSDNYKAHLKTHIGEPCTTSNTSKCCSAQHSTLNSISPTSTEDSSASIEVANMYTPVTTTPWFKKRGRKPKTQSTGANSVQKPKTKNSKKQQSKTKHAALQEALMS
ncbi:hypothetical protein ACO0QE_001990 [Hanseniaspora vineae]